MLIYLDFTCPVCELTFEKLVPHQTQEHVCECGSMAKRIISPIRVKGDPMCDPNWEKKRMKQVAYERKKEEG